MLYEQVLDRLRAEPRAWLVTGVAGFIGSNVLEVLLEARQKVVGLDNFSTGYERNLADVRDSVGDELWDNFTFVEGDIRDPRDCAASVRGVDYVLHQAALGSVSRSILDPLSTNQSNVDGFVNMLVAARDARVERFVYASSSSVYGDHAGLPKIEDRVGNPLSPYAVTKRANELYAEAFSQNYDIQVIGLRYFNVFGARQNPHGGYAAVIPRWIGNLFAHRPCTINGDGQTSRDFCYVENAIQANLLAATTSRGDAVNQVYNVAFGGRTTLNGLYFLIRDTVMGLTGANELANLEPAYGPFRPGDVRHSQADIDKANRLLGYEPTHSVEQGLYRTVTWYAARMGERQIHRSSRGYGDER